MTVSPRSLAVAVLLVLPATASACLWDHDTLAMERARFPSTLELITGKFLRHSPEFYQWRIRDRLAKLEKEPNDLRLLDDLAVAYAKTGQIDKAIETAQRSLKIAPDRYESLANLGTFYILTGELEKSAAAIEKAVTINPDAHFGREKYQLVLVRYAISCRKEGKLPLPLRPASELHSAEKGFAAFLAASTGQKQLSEAEQAAAIEGVLGMMKFGFYDHPVLLEALGDLLLHPMYHMTRDGKQLATRAYLKVAYDSKNASYRELADAALRMQTRTGSDSSQMKFEDLEATFRGELAEANAWYEELRQKELGWIRDGLDADAEFDKLYDREPELSGPVGPDLLHVLEAQKPWYVDVILGAILGIGFVGLVVLAVFRVRRRLRSL